MTFAYIDAGSGTMLLQVVIAGAVAIPFFFRNALTAGWRRLRGRGDEPRASEPTRQDGAEES